MEKWTQRLHAVFEDGLAESITDDKRRTELSKITILG